MTAKSLYSRADKVSGHLLVRKADILQPSYFVNYRTGNTANGVLHMLPSIPSRLQDPSLQLRAQQVTSQARTTVLAPSQMNTLLELQAGP